MAEYRAGLLAPKTRTVVKSAASVAPNQLVLTYPQLNVLIMTDDASDQLLAETVKEFRSVECRVAFAAPTCRNLTELAQKSGARYYPIGEGRSAFSEFEKIEVNLSARWGAIDVVVNFTGQGLGRVPEGAKVLTPWSDCTARTLLILAHPDVNFQNS